MYAEYHYDLVAMGYDIIPVHRDGKAPIPSDWSNYTKRKMLKAAKRWPDESIGMLTSKNPCIDVDCLNPDLAGMMVRYLRPLFPESLERVGRAPKTLFICRTDTPFSKMASKIYTDAEGHKNQVEILGKGQQAVIWGNHATTKLPYAYVGDEIHDVWPYELDELTPEMAEAIIEQFERFAEGLGMTEQVKALKVSSGDAATEGENWGLGCANVEEQATILDALASLDADMHNDDWVQVGMALHNAYSGSDEGFAVWADWSDTSGNPDHHGCDYGARWRSFKDDAGRGNVGFLTILKMARSVGWEDPTGEVFYSDTKDAISNMVLEHAEKLTKTIDAAINKAIHDGNTDQRYVAPEVVATILATTFWSGIKNRGLMLDVTGDNIVQFAEKDILTQCQLIHGGLYDADALALRLDAAQAADEGMRISDRKAIEGLPASFLLNHIKLRNHRDAMTLATDTFIEDSKMLIKTDDVAIKFKHIPLATRLPEGAIDPEIIADYKDHFTRLDVFIDFIVQSRFASDRKYAYLWIKADSDWGKGFLMSAISCMDYNPGVITALSVKEVERMFEGGPVGKSISEFKRSFILHFDEFKSVKSELKQLENCIQVSPKNQLQFTAKVFAKIFTSAEGVPSLIGDSGVEDQFANRFSLFEESGMLSDRPVFKAKGKAAYMDSVQSYICHGLNARIEKMKAMGEKASADHGDRWLEKFIANHGIANHADRLSDTLPGVAEDFLDWIYAKCPGSFDDVRPNLLESSDGLHHYLKSPKTTYEQFVERPGGFSYHEKITMGKKYEAIFKLISADGGGKPKTVAIKGLPGRNKALKLLPPNNCVRCKTHNHGRAEPCLAAF